MVGGGGGGGNGHAGRIEVGDGGEDVVDRRRRQVRIESQRYHDEKEFGPGSVGGVGVTDHKAWTQMYNELEKYVKEHYGSLPSTQKPKFGRWIRLQKYNKRNSINMTDEMVRLLELLPGWSWDIGEAKRFPFSLQKELVAAALLLDMGHIVFTRNYNAMKKEGRVLVDATFQNWEIKYKKTSIERLRDGGLDKKNVIKFMKIANSFGEQTDKVRRNMEQGIAIVNSTIREGVMDRERARRLANGVAVAGGTEQTGDPANRRLANGVAMAFAPVQPADAAHFFRINTHDAAEREYQFNSAVTYSRKRKRTTMTSFLNSLPRNIPVEIFEKWLNAIGLNGKSTRRVYVSMLYINKYQQTHNPEQFVEYWNSFNDKLRLKLDTFMEALDDLENPP